MSSINNCPKPEPCELQTFTVSATSTHPPSSVDWRIQLPYVEHMYYQNITYDLIAVLIARIGIEFARADLSGDASGMEAAIGELRNAIKGDKTVP